MALIQTMRVLPKSGGTILIAADDAPNIIKQVADYICDGTNDEVQIHAAMAVLNTSPSKGGKICLSIGNFYLGATLSFTDGAIWLAGSGEGHGDNDMATFIHLANGVDADGIAMTGDETIYWEASYDP